MMTRLRDASFLAHLAAACLRQNTTLTTKRLSLLAVAFFMITATPARVAALAGYRLVDIGTFRGLNSSPAFAPLFEFPSAQSLSRNGVLVGQLDTASPDPFAPNCFMEDCAIHHAFKWRNGVFTDLGALIAGYSSVALWTSGNGLVLGLSSGR